MREVQLIREAIAAFELDLTGLTVFTEAATGYFRCTAAIALAAGAARVLAIAKSSHHGSIASARDAVTQLVRELGVERGLSLVDNADQIAEADIVTNTGFVRPITDDVVSRMRRDAVIPLMWETWEFRPADLDLRACLERDILVLGTNEDDPRLQTKVLVGVVAERLLQQAEVTIAGAAIVVLGGGVFGSSIGRRLDAMGARVSIRCAGPLDGDVAHLRSAVPWRDLVDVSALVVADHESTHLLVGPAGELSVQDLVAANSNLTVVHVSGLIDAPGIRAAGCRLMPGIIARAPRTMSLTTSYLGPHPVIQLHTAGLRVGQIMARERRRRPTVAAARRSALEDRLCQDFSESQYAHFQAKTAGS